MKKKVVTIAMANMRIGRNDENLTNNGHGNDEKHRNYDEKKYTF